MKDKKGEFVNGLTAKNFTVTEDGVPQTIKFCEHQQFSEAVEPLPPNPWTMTILPSTKSSHARSLPRRAPESKKYNDRRLLALYFDMTAMQPQDQMRALTAAEHFVRTQMTAADMISILRFNGGSVDVLQDFTADRNRLLSILETLIVGEGQGSADSIDDASSADTGAAFGQDDSEFNIFNTDRQLSALQTTAKMLGADEREEIAHLLCKRPAPEWRGQQRNCTQPSMQQCGQGLLSGRWMRGAGGERAAWRCNAGQFG